MIDYTLADKKFKNNKWRSESCQWGISVCSHHFWLTRLWSECVWRHWAGDINKIYSFVSLNSDSKVA